ncbi:M14 family metallopeptidase [Fusibacter ferrireducens]|uniref:DUF2817 domain-containing protein n=1 Tax=Fusibacter ferrireducens TaxID=2785058 RepID=A0ABR9ZTX8_9FIRM|nr:M14 family metallopeptidase [Fusibacter ferrireducens]MBF4693912.1 DUF2817 domain-containing protein [Fusibacter ferrireducens]
MATFYKEYEPARKAFLAFTDQIKQMTGQSLDVQLTSHEIIEGLFMDVLEIKPDKPQRLLCLTSGLHGIEGYAGNYVLQEFVDCFLPKLNLEDTHVILVHAINPYGMKYKRKSNENSVDLNRNFNASFDTLHSNEGFKTNASFFLPRKLKNPYLIENILFYIRTAKLYFTIPHEQFREAALLGQYEFPNGFYYGGDHMEKSTAILAQLYQKLVSFPYNKRLFIDLHTGYGPKYQMSIVNSPNEKRSVSELKKAFNYPLIQNANGDDFYQINGDMVNYINDFIQATDYATCFEFGTIGMSILDEIKSLRIMLEENSVHHMHRETDPIFKRIKKDFEQLYMPDEKKWLDKVITDFDQALKGILTHYKFI